MILCCTWPDEWSDTRPSAWKPPRSLTRIFHGGALPSRAYPLPSPPALVVPVCAHPTPVTSPDRMTHPHSVSSSSTGVRSPGTRSPWASRSRTRRWSGVRSTQDMVGRYGAAVTSHAGRIEGMPIAVAFRSPLRMGVPGRATVLDSPLRSHSRPTVGRAIRPQGVRRLRKQSG